MTKNMTNTPLILVGVSAEGVPAPRLREQLCDALGAAGVQFATEDCQILADKDQTSAAEITFTETADTNMDAAHTALSGFAGDYAILPAANRKKRLLICDMDSTIIAEECLDELADFAGLKKEISDITERAMAGELNFEEALTTRVAMLEGLPLSAIEDCYASRIHLNAGAQTLVATMKANGARCLLVSGGFTAFTSRVAAAAGFHDHHANSLLDDGKALTGKVQMPILGREAKLERLNAAANSLGCTATDALAMGDGANDLAMITAAGLGLAYRAKPIVAAEADAAIKATDLNTALFYQGYTADEFVTG